MAYSNEKVAEKFALGKEANGRHMYSTGNVVYSYGQHFPIAFRFAPNKYLFNKDNYSSSTLRHQRHVARELAIPENQIWYCHTKEIQQAIMSPPGEPIIVVENLKPTSIREALGYLRDVCKEAGMKRFQFEKMYRKLQGQIVMQAI